MFWNCVTKEWQRHPDCTCGVDCCICRFLRPLDANGQPLEYPEMDALRAREQPQAEPELVGVKSRGDSKRKGR